MQMKLSASALVVIACAAAACGVREVKEPPLAGPSDLSLSVRVTATPDVVRLGQYGLFGGESSQILVTVNGPTGAPVANKAVHLDILVGNQTTGFVMADCGSLSVRDVVTGSDGRAVSVFTAPTQPLPEPECAQFAPGAFVTIAATPVGTNFQTASSRTAAIQMLLPTVIAAPGAPVVNFVISPTTAKVGDEVSFSDAGSYAAAGRTILSYRWDFSDGITKNGRFVQHDFAAPGTYTVTLTVTDDIGQVSFKSASIVITS
jgi:plastocyanin